MEFRRKKITADEFGSRSFEIVGNNSLFEAYDKDYLRVWPIIYCYERHAPLSEKISKGLRAFYFPNGVDITERKAIADLYADGVIGFGTNRATKLLSKYNSEKVFSYLFNYHGNYTHAYYPNTNRTVPYGVSHHDDLLYLFYVSVLTPLFNAAPESEIVDKMTKIWSNFARTGSPTQSGAANNVLGSVQWPPFNLESESFMDIDTKLVVREKLYDSRYTTWSGLIPLNGNSDSKS
ncbi:esterase [Oryctes borbonicus]|uniref:Esterase n=1 Tax=Oryctes borbonicus TaxID=1629725 RepID=A0A0T6B1Q3_9SCAR|nr:esterase [Oryctes borbonicus]